ncbi:MAG: hypothetical protein FD135_14 [Comamonadaceae bacterium]|nr:MAG: hypothetical protein FD135_14 [Comamonadaceae bacterium]
MSYKVHSCMRTIYKDYSQKYHDFWQHQKQNRANHSPYPVAASASCISGCASSAAGVVPSQRRNSRKHPVETMPWGQTIAYVADINGFLVELCTPMG